MDLIVIGCDETGISGLALGASGLIVILLVCIAANWISWHRPRALQRASRWLVEGLMRISVDPLLPRAQYKKEEISPYFWPNGIVPVSNEWLHLAASDFKDYRLRVHGLVRRPLELSLDEIKNLGRQEQITMHHCIQGWSGIAQWGGLPLGRLLAMVEPAPEARWVAFHSFSEGLFGGEYYDCHSIENVLHPQSLLAYEMNYQPLSRLHGAPLRLRVENQLGYKQVKWIKSVEFIASVKELGKGQGGKNEDDEYYDLVASI
jgi:DMSO/TMAO reductase YedYZ molybdopterin-dependent catalytic subunit